MHTRPSISAMQPTKRKRPVASFDARVQSEMLASETLREMHERERDPFVISIMVVLRLFAFASGVAVVAYEWSHYENGQICARYVNASSPYRICASTGWQLFVLTVTRYMAGKYMCNPSLSRPN